VVHTVDYQLIAGNLYKLGLEKSLVYEYLIMSGQRSCGNVIMEFWEEMLEGKRLPRIYFNQDYGGLLSSKMPRNMPEHVMYDIGSGNPSHGDEFSLHLVRSLQSFEKWVVDFIG
jgi:hypothetical protein